MITKQPNLRGVTICNCYKFQKGKITSGIIMNISLINYFGRKILKVFSDFMYQSNGSATTVLIFHI